MTEESRQKLLEMKPCQYCGIDEKGETSGFEIADPFHPNGQKIILQFADGNISIALLSAEETIGSGLLRV